MGAIEQQGLRWFLLLVAAVQIRDGIRDVGDHDADFFKDSSSYCKKQCHGESKQPIERIDFDRYQDYQEGDAVKQKGHKCGDFAKQWIRALGADA